MAALRTIVKLPFLIAEALLLGAIAAVFGPVAWILGSRRVRKACFAVGLLVTVGVMTVGVLYTPAGFRGAFQGPAVHEAV